MVSEQIKVPASLVADMRLHHAEMLRAEKHIKAEAVRKGNEMVAVKATGIIKATNELIRIYEEMVSEDFELV